MWQKTWIRLGTALGGLALFASASCSSSEDIEEPTTSTELSLVPSGFTEELIVSGLGQTTAMEFAPDGRLFVAQQTGPLRVIKNGSLLSAPFVTVPTGSNGERGLLGVTLDPSFASNGFVYVYYTAATPTTHNRLSRFTANGDVAVAGSEVVLLDLENLSSATNHNGGALHFGPDGKLYVAVGENANANNSQTLANRLGKLLRINADGSIPSDNPFFGTATGVNRSIWALGLRNPFTFTFQPNTGRLFINDVGGGSWEEINDGIAGSNYGWPTTEGATTDSRFRSPLFSYGHSSSATTGCAITGGAFYNPATVQFPSSYVGKYFFGDYCSGWIRLFNPQTGTAENFASGLNAPIDLDVGADGLLYYLSRNGSVSRIRAATSQAPSITAQPQSTTVGPGQQATFTVSATGSQPLTYQWQRGTTNISGATSAAYTLTTTASDNGATFRVVVTNAVGSVTSSSATLTVAGAAPVATITQPVAGSLYSGGETIQYAGTGTDTEDGTLPASAFTWEVVFHHDTHSHPFVAPVTGSKTGSFTIPRLGEFATNVWYRIRLTVTDSTGLTSTTERTIAPRLSTLQLRSNPTTLQLALEGQPVTTPADIPSVVGMTRTLGVVSPQAQGSTNYAFSAWSDGGAATHTVDTPSSATTYTATFVPSGSAATNLASQGTPVALITAPTGGGNRNLAVIRDGVKPAVGSTSSSLQYDTYAGGGARASDWIGYSFTSSYTWNRVVFQEGRQFGDGGWFTTLTVEVRQAGNWVPVSNLQITPAYPAANGVTFETFQLAFSPIAGDAIRIIGAPGGTARFISVAELEVYGTASAPGPGNTGGTNRASQGTPVALITAPTGGGSRNLALIRDGVKPAVGSTSSSLQYDTYAGGGARASDWIGYSFTSSYTWNRVVFQEGRQFADGGWFTTLTVQVRQAGNWVPVSNLQITPAYPAANGVTYETFQLAFSPIAGDAIRIIGAPGGTARFISVGELEVYGP